MEITIDQTKKLSDIQTEFCKRFPCLKIEFYKQAHTAGEGSPKEKTIDSNLTINEVQIEKEIGVIKITGLMTVAELESSFSNTFGLSAQVFRKSGSIWLQTTVSDHWTLAEQNQKAMEKHELSQDETVDAMDRMELE
jgi:uncharacterized pyridoxal phosphate-containing UPF0001 family protein